MQLHLFEILHTRRAGTYCVIQGSLNLTQTARQATAQLSYVWWADLPVGDPWLTHVRSDYKQQSKGCQLFMGDLADLIRHSSDRDTEALIDACVSGGTGEATDFESRKVLQGLTSRSLQNVQSNADSVLTITLPSHTPSAARLGWSVGKRTRRLGIELESDFRHCAFEPEQEAVIENSLMVDARHRRRAYPPGRTRSSKWYQSPLLRATRETSMDTMTPPSDNSKEHSDRRRSTLFPGTPALT
jgi:hypothetical protein